MSANTGSLLLQGSLFGVDEPAIDEAFASLKRVELDDETWLDHAPEWLRGHDVVFDRLLHELPWRQRTVTMYERRLPEPRLTWWWSTESGGPEPLSILAAMRHALTRRYDKVFDSIGFNCYRHGEDSVAWHGDRHRHTVANPIVAIVSAGAPRPFRLRPRGGGRARTFDLGHGDLFVMGGACQHHWEHSVPKVRHAEPRISISYRHEANGLRGPADGQAGETPKRSCEAASSEGGEQFDCEPSLGPESIR